MKSSRLFVVLSLLVIGSLVQSGLGAKAKKNGQQQRVARQDEDDDIDLSAELELDEDGRDLKEMIKADAGGTSVGTSAQEGGANLRFKQVIPWKIQHVINKKRKYITVSTAYTVTTTTVHVTSPTAALCAKLVNVTGACRLRRGLWVEDPIILSFDDDMDAIDGPLSPTAALKIEPTALPTEHRDAIPESGSPSKEVIQPSTASTASDDDDDDDGLDPEDEEAVGRLGFRNFLALKLALKKRLKMKHLVTIITTSVLTSTTTSTEYTTVTTKTFFIQLCTPSPFPFNVCPGRKK